MASSKYFKSTRGKPAPIDSSGASPIRVEQNASLETLFAEVGKISATLHKVASDVSTIKETTAELKNAVNAMQERLTEVEGRVSDIEDTKQQLVSNSELHSKRINTLWDRVEDLENRSRRNNVRLLGLSEGIEGDNIKACINKILSEGLGLDVDSEFEIERAHRSPGSRPINAQSPRLVMMKFLRSTARDKVLKAAREKGGAVWCGCNISLFPDMTKELAERRKAFSKAKQLLHQKKVRFSLAFPATLGFTWRGRSRKFQDASEAVKFIEQQMTVTEYNAGDNPDGE